MPEIKESASYVRVHRASAAVGEAGNADRILELLRTPHTVDSLYRVLAKEASAQASRETIVAAMNDLYARDLIELLPDS